VRIVGRSHDREAVRDAMRNWAGNHEYRARRVYEPTSVGELQELVRASPRIRALGSRHSFNDLADSDGDLISLAHLPRLLEIDTAGQTVTIDGGARYGDICASVNDAGLAFHNLASLPHISVVGACATGTHGSGERRGNLSTAVRSMDLVRADGELVTIDRERAAGVWAAAVISLGALGVVARLTLDAEPTYLAQQAVFENLPREVLFEHFDEIEAIADSVSLFTEWRGPMIDQVWLKQRVDEIHELPSELFGATPASANRHPIRGLSADACTPQLRAIGPWHERLPHFRMEFTPSAGDELQSEYFVGREDAIDAFLALDKLRDRIASLIQVSEIRTVAADDLCLSPAFGRPSVAFHFTWRSDWPSVRALLPEIEVALAPFRPRPHWGKLFTLAPTEIREGYPRLPDFVALTGQLDADGKFQNDFLRRNVLG
jgi:xylitol oxidase